MARRGPVNYEPVSVSYARSGSRAFGLRPAVPLALCFTYRPAYASSLALASWACSRMRTYFCGCFLRVLPVGLLWCANATTPRRDPKDSRRDNFTFWAECVVNFETVFSVTQLSLGPQDRAPSGRSPQSCWLRCSLLTYRPGHASSLAPRQRRQHNVNSLPRKP
jgi:hypothetical protein